MNSKEQTTMKKQEKNRWLQLIGLVLMTLAFSLAGSLLGLLVEIPFKATGNAAITFMGYYMNFIGIWIVVILFFIIRKKDIKFLSKLGPKCKGNNWKTVLAIGLPCGIGLNLLVAAAAMLHGDITLKFIQFSPLMVLGFLLCVLVQSSAEELLSRFYLYQKAKELFPNAPLVPIILNAGYFGVMHIFNDGITVVALVNLLLCGILYSLIIYYFDSFWAAAVAHASWNFCQNILLGLPNSGIVSAYSVFGLSGAAKNSFAYNVNFGIEGTILSSALMIIACVVIILVGRKRKAKIAAAATLEITEEALAVA